MAKQLPRIQPQILSNQQIFNLSGGLNDNANPLAVADNEFSDGRNMTLDQDNTWTGRGGILQLGQYLGATTDVLGIFEYYRPTTGVRSVFVVYDTDVYLLSGSTLTAQSRSLTTNKRAEFTNGNDCLYMVNGYDVVQKYNGSSWSTLANFPVSSAASTDIPNGICFFKERIIAWNTTTHPNRVYYSNAAAETIGSANYFDVLEPVVKCLPYGDVFLLVFTENHVYSVDTFMFTGTTYEPNRIRELILSKGCVAQRSIKRVGNYVYYIGRDGVKRTDGNVEQNISIDRIDNLFGSISQSYLSNACAGVIDGLYYLSVSTSGTANNLILIYDTKTNIWYPPIDTHSISCFETRISSSAEELIGGSDADSTTYTFNNSVIYDGSIGAEYTTGYDSDLLISASAEVKKAQKFYLSQRLTITAIQIPIAKYTGTTTELSIRIETDTLGLSYSGSPTGTLANSNASATQAALSSTTYSWKTITFSTPFTLDAGYYWIVVGHTTEATGDSIHKWQADGSSPTYSSGYSASTESPGVWTEDNSKDLLFRVISQVPYTKYLTTKGYFLGDPQKVKKIRKLYVNAAASGAWNLNLGVNIDTSNIFTNFQIDLGGSASIRGSVVRGHFTRGSQTKISEFIDPDSLEGRIIKLKYFNSNASENFKVYGAEINYQTIDLLR